MLYPKINEYRELMDLSGFWDFRADPGDDGLAEGWAEGPPRCVPIAVPASWNDQLPSLRDFLGPAWYATRFELPRAWHHGRLLVRFDSVNYLAEVWMNGKRLGSHEGGHLPFSFDATEAARAGANLLVVRVDGRLAPDRVPPGGVPPSPLDAFPSGPFFPDGSFDFFPFCGIQRTVRLCLLPEGAIERIEVEPSLAGPGALVRVRIDGGAGSSARVTLAGHGAELAAQADLPSGEATVELRVPGPALWSCETPNLYELSVALSRGGVPFDSYSLPVGLRDVAVDGERLLVNGRPVRLKGFGRHEDFPVAGRGFLPPVIVRDYELMRWVGANSFRTTHYPYSEEMMDLADRFGFLVIDETPAVGLFFAEAGLTRRSELCAAFTRELIERDRNHPCVVAWSLANEPHSRRPEALARLRALVDLAKSLDPSRPVTLASYLGSGEEAFAFCDVVCLNRYFGWYEAGGRIEEAAGRLSEELDTLHAKLSKPIILTEFGADAVPGFHAEPPEMFSEEYQARLIERLLEVARSKPYVVGAHVWNLCDFKTGQAVHRAEGMNFKGVFTRDRRPKMAAHLLRRLWGASEARPSLPATPDRRAETPDGSAF